MMLILFKGLAVVLGFLLMREFRLTMASIRTERWRSATGALEDGSSGSNLRYSFSVEGKDYHSSQIGFGIPFPFALERFFARAPLNEILANAPSLTVYYDPWNPDNSVLITGFKPFHSVRLACVFLVFLSVCLVAFF